MSFHSSLRASSSCASSLVPHPLCFILRASSSCRLAFLFSSLAFALLPHLFLLPHYIYFHISSTSTTSGLTSRAIRIHIFPCNWKNNPLIHISIPIPELPVCWQLIHAIREKNTTKARTGRFPNPNPNPNRNPNSNARP